MHIKYSHYNIILVQYLPIVMCCSKPHTVQSGLQKELPLAHSQLSSSRCATSPGWWTASWKMLPTKLYLCVISSFVFIQDVCPEKTKIILFKLDPILPGK